jgi:hypothetical protein
MRGVRERSSGQSIVTLVNNGLLGCSDMLTVGCIGNKGGQGGAVFGQWQRP